MVWIPPAVRYRYSTDRYAVYRCPEVGAVGGVCVVEPVPELLVVLAPPASLSSRAAGRRGDRGADREPGGDDCHQVVGDLRGFAQVTAILPPRLALVATPADGAGALARLPGVVGVFTHTVPAGLRETLTATENLFVDAWLARLAGKSRPGEGLPWDAAGRLPPDPAGEAGSPASDAG